MHQQLDAVVQPILLVQSEVCEELLKQSNIYKEVLKTKERIGEIDPLRNGNAAEIPL